MRSIERILVAIVASTLCSCLAPHNVEMVDVDMESWHSADSLVYDNIDTLSLRNLNIAIRYNDNFKQSVLPLKIGITTPDSLYFEEEITLRTNRPRTSLAVATTESISYRTDVVLNQKGCYTFSFEPLSEVRGVEAVGIEFN